MRSCAGAPRLVDGLQSRALGHFCCNRPPRHIPLSPRGAVPPNTSSKRKETRENSKNRSVQSLEEILLRVCDDLTRRRRPRNGRIVNRSENNFSLLPDQELSNEGHRRHSTLYTASFRPEGGPEDDLRGARPEQEQLLLRSGYSPLVTAEEKPA